LAKIAVGVPGFTWLIESTGLASEDVALFDLRRGQRHPGSRRVVETDFKGVLPRLGKRYVEYQHGPRLKFGHPGDRFAELHGAFASHQLLALIIHELDPNGVAADFRTPASNPEDKVGPRIYGGECGYPDVLKNPDDRKLSLLVDQGVIGDDGKIEVQVRTPGSR
jgi:hypothetical protein